AKPVRKEASDFRTRRTHAPKQAVAVAAGVSTPTLEAGCDGRIERDSRRRGLRIGTVTHPLLRSLEPFQLDRIESFAQDRLEGILPSRLDVESLPQAAGLGDAVIREPLRTVLALPDLLLQRGQRLGAGLDVGELVPGLLRGVARCPLPFLQVLHRVAQRIQAGLFRGELRFLLAEL